MSSNIKVQRICQHCGKEFTARTTVTRYCGDQCSKRAYKARLKSSKVELSNNETSFIKTKPLEEIKSKEFLTVRDVASLLSCSIRTAYRLVKLGNIKAVNIAQRKTLIKRSELDKLFEMSINEVLTKPELSKPTDYKIVDCYTLTEIQKKYGISEKALSDLIKRNGIAKIREGIYVYVPKVVIDKIFKP
ncbi:MAG: helix-turn-helix domain-containing protein [Sphingobacteriaceae bacterium]